MSDIEFGYIGWCKDEKNNHDKVWCYFKVSDTWYAGWGRRGKKLSFKNHGQGVYGEAPRSLRKAREQKECHKGYNEVDKFTLFAVFPYFEDTVHKELFVKTLSGKVM